MADLIYTATVSLDGFVEDDRGSFDVTAPDDEVFAYITGLERSAGGSGDGQDSAGTRLRRRRLRTMKASAAGHLTVGGADLARQAFRAGLIDECRLFICPVLVGGGRPALPRDMRVELELIDEQRFSSGVMYLAYRVTT